MEKKSYFSGKVLLINLYSRKWKWIMLILKKEISEDASKPIRTFRVRMVAEQPSNEAVSIQM